MLIGYFEFLLIPFAVRSYIFNDSHIEIDHVSFSSTQTMNILHTK